MSKAEIKNELTHYSPWMRLTEIVSIIVFSILWINLIVIAWKNESTFQWMFFLSILAGLIAADATSGVVHWAADTWGSVRWPILGPTLIRGFREHHVDQKAITRHDFIEANGATALIIIPWLLACTYWIPTTTWIFFLWNSFLWLCVWSLMTNQFHKWSHLNDLPSWIKILQNAGIIISPEQHRMHHRGDHLTHYCITTGWLNRLEQRLSVFRKLENTITKLTGTKPREDEQRIVNQLRSMM